MRGEVHIFLFPILHWAWPIVHCEPGQMCSYLQNCVRWKQFWNTYSLLQNFRFYNEGQNAKSTSPSLCTTSAVSSAILLPLPSVPPKITIEFHGDGGVQAVWKYLPLENFSIIHKEFWYEDMSVYVYVKQHWQTQPKTKANTITSFTISLIYLDIHDGAHP